MIREAEILFIITKEVTGVLKEEIISKSRKYYIVDAKRMMAVVLFKNTKLTFEKIGEILGGLDHSSISYYLKTHDNLIDSVQGFKKQFSLINAKFKVYQEGGTPVEIELEIALEKRKEINKNIVRLKKLLNIKNK